MKAKDLSLSGILIALTIIILYSTALIPISTLSVLTLASCLIPISIIRSNTKVAFLIYISSTIISFFFVPINIVIFYALFFGLYGIIKYYIEKLRKLYLEIPLKLLFFNTIFFVSFILLTKLLTTIPVQIPLWILFVLAQPVFLLFDYALTLIISFYLDKIHKHI